MDNLIKDLESVEFVLYHEHMCDEYGGIVHKAIERLKQQQELLDNLKDVNFVEANILRGNINLGKYWIRKTDELGEFKQMEGRIRDLEKEGKRIMDAIHLWADSPSGLSTLEYQKIEDDLVRISINAKKDNPDA